ncbi:hypothetical protein ACIRL3_25990 [Streptomyces sp. NPDC102384]|uniref:hypothetical protein n=1 Tax=Streptomyces sp. NPDC102384 TaxID=3366166 RepID=UPI00380C2610
MPSRWKRVWWAARQPEPPKKLTLREVVATVVVYAAAIDVFGLITGRWEDAIGGGISGAGGTLLGWWWNGRTAQPEYEDVDGGNE